MHVVADLLNVFANPKKSRKLQDQEGQRGQRTCPCDDGQNHDNLCSNGGASQALAACTIVAGHAAETAPAVIVVKALPPIEETSGEKPPDAAGSVHCAGIHGVVDLQSHKETGRRLVEESTNEAGENSTAALHVSAARSDGDQARKNSVTKRADIVLAHEHELQQEHGDPTGGGGKSGVHGNLCCEGTHLLIVHREGGSWVEAIPAEPKREGSEHDP